MQTFFRIFYLTDAETIEAFQLVFVKKMLVWLITKKIYNMIFPLSDYHEIYSR